MISEDAGDLALAVGLTGVAGFVDAVGFLKLGRLFVSFMSGNSTQFAVAVSHNASSAAAAAGAIVALFVLGVIIGRLLGRAAKDWRRPVVLLAETILLGAAAMASSNVAVVLMVTAMGMQNAVIHQAGGTKARLTYVTGTLVAFGEKLADALSSPKTGGRFAWAADLCLWIGLVIGAWLGACAYAAFGGRALLCAAAVLAGFGALTGARTRRGGV